MVKKQDFIIRVLEIIKKDLDRVLPDQDTLGDMWEDFEQYLEEKFLGNRKRGKK
jgi:hypothetical protein